MRLPNIRRYQSQQHAGKQPGVYPPLMLCRRARTRSVFQSAVLIGCRQQSTGPHAGAPLFWPRPIRTPAPSTPPTPTPCPPRPQHQTRHQPSAHTLFFGASRDSGALQCFAPFSCSNDRFPSPSKYNCRSGPAETTDRDRVPRCFAARYRGAAVPVGPADAPENGTHYFVI